MKKLLLIFIGVLLILCTMQYSTIYKIKKTVTKMENQIEILQNENIILKANKINILNDKNYYLKEVQINKKKYTINLNEILEIKETLEELPEELEKFQIDRIDPNVIYADNKYAYLILNYNCGVKLCDYCIIKYDLQNKKVIKSNNIAFSCLYTSAILSQKNDTVCIIFSKYTYGKNTFIEKNHLSIIDFRYLEEIPICNSFIGNYKSKINSITWINDNSFSVEGILDNGENFDVILERDFNYVRGYFHLQ